MIMSIYDVIFREKRINKDKLLKLGLSVENGVYTLKKGIEPQPMYAQITCDGERFDVKIFDKETSDEYTLHLIDGAEGEFVGCVRAQYESILRELCEGCCDSVTFKRSQSAAVLLYAEKAYGAKPEYLWEDLPDCAVLRRDDTNKWYAVIMRVGGDKFGHDPVCDEVIDLKICPDELDKIVDGKNFFRGYHMNKKHWLTIVLDGSVEDERIFKFLDESFALAKK